jgi:PTH1 family peptidyl-tRNA hydrolase
MYLVVGLGNPGKAYATHRHNVGFMALDVLAARRGAESFRDKFSGETTRVRVGAGEPSVLLKPTTFMNDSGRSVQPAMAFFRVPPERLVVVHDELDLPFGVVRLKVGGGHAGHNGLRSILGRVPGDFVRVRFGIGRPPADFRGDVADFVLSPFTADERTALPELLERAVDVVEDVLTRGPAAAMNDRNQREPKAPKPPKVAKPREPAAKPEGSGSPEGSG